MKKSELITSIANHFTLLPHVDVEAAVNTMLERMCWELAHGGRVEIRNFGTFSLRQRAARLSRNPKTGQSVAVEKKHAIHFKMGTELRKRVDESSKHYSIQVCNVD